MDQRPSPLHSCCWRAWLPCFRHGCFRSRRGLALLVALDGVRSTTLLPLHPNTCGVTRRCIRPGMAVDLLALVLYIFPPPFSAADLGRCAAKRPVSVVATSGLLCWANYW